MRVNDKVPEAVGVELHTNINIILVLYYIKKYLHMLLLDLS